MRKRWYMIGSMALAISMGTNIMAAPSSYLTQSEYGDILYDNYIEDRGIVVENSPELGYLVYRNSNGQELTANYYPEQVEVEKKPYYEGEDRIGYLDQLFPNFEYDPIDSTIYNIEPGDNIYIRKNFEGYITYINAYNDYIMRYGKVVSFDYNTGNTVSLQLQDEKGNLYYYDVDIATPATKASKSCALSTIKAGDWVKVLVSQKILGEGIIDEAVLEIVIDNDTRTISNIYRGQITSVNTYKQLLNMKNAQTLQKKSWSTYNDLISLNVDTKTSAIYKAGNRVSFDYLKRYLINADGYVYVAAENYKGKENAVKLNFQDKLQTTLAATTVISATPTSVKLLSGQELHIAEDSIIVRDKRLVGATNIMVGDRLQAVVTGENKLAVGYITSDQTTGSLQVYRGRIKKITDRESFQVETFSMLNDNTWYYHPTPQTFTIDNTTKFYNEGGVIEGGINTFLDYGENTNVSEVYTIVAAGEHAYMVVDMPYMTDSVKGEIYEAEDGTIKIKDAYYYDTKLKKWREYSRKNIGATITLKDNAVILKNGQIVSKGKLEVGDTITAMVEQDLKTGNGTATSYVITVEN